MTMTKEERVDVYLRASRIGKALLRIYNRDHDTTYALRDVRFVAFRGDDSFGHVGMVVQGKVTSMRIGHLYTILGQDISSVESAFFQSLDIGYN